MQPPSDADILWTCPKCDESYPMTPSNWYWDKTNARYLKICKRCHMSRVAAARQRRRASSDVEPSVPKWFRRAYNRMWKKNQALRESGRTVTARELYELHLRQDGKCYYTGLSYEQGEFGSKRPPRAISVDRLDSSKGYIDGNVVMCCWFVNCAKNAWPLEEMYELWDKLPKRQ